MPTDEKLIDQIRDGDPDAVAELYGRYALLVWRFVCSRMQDTHSGQDVMSETFVAAIQSVRKGVRADNVTAWLTGIARNKIADWYRQRKESVGVEADLLPQLVSPVNIIVAETLDAMQAEQRLVLEWKYFDRCSVREIAERMGRTEKTIESLLFRARKAFREQYESAIQ